MLLILDSKEAVEILCDCQCLTDDDVVEIIMQIFDLMVFHLNNFKDVILDQFPNFDKLILNPAPDEEVAQMVASAQSVALNLYDHLNDLNAFSIDEDGEPSLMFAFHELLEGGDIVVRSLA